MSATLTETGVLLEDDEEFRLKWTRAMHRQECADCWMASGRLSSTRQGRWVVRRYRAVQVVGLCGFGKHLEMALLRLRTKE